MAAFDTLRVINRTNALYRDMRIAEKEYHDVYQSVIDEIWESAGGLQVPHE